MMVMFSDVLSCVSRLDRSLARPEPATAPTIFVVSEDDYARRSLERMIALHGLDVEHCISTEELLSRPPVGVPHCVVLCVSPGQHGLEVQQRVCAQLDAPLIVVGRLDVRVTVQVMKAGAVDVIAAPVDHDQLLAAVSTAIGLSRAAQLREAALRMLRESYASLTPREREVMGLVVAGLLNKQVAFELGISEITVKAHRGQVMRKMQAGSLPHLVRMAARLDGSY